MAQGPVAQGPVAQGPVAQGLCGSRALWLKGLWLKGLRLKLTECLLTDTKNSIFVPGKKFHFKTTLTDKNDLFLIQISLTPVQVATDV